MTTDSPVDLHLKVRNLCIEDYPRLEELMDEVYADISGAWPEHSIRALIADG